VIIGIEFDFFNIHFNFTLATEQLGHPAQDCERNESNTGEVKSVGTDCVDGNLVSLLVRDEGDCGQDSHRYNH